MSYADANFFTNAQAQDFAFCVGHQGLEVVKQTLEARQSYATVRIQRVLAACEVVAAANGHTDAEAGSCVFIDQWLFETGYVPDNATTDVAIKRCNRIMAQNDVASKLGVSADRFESLQARLAMPPRKVNRKPPKDNRPSFRELAKWLNTSQGEVDSGPQFDRHGNARVVLVYVTANAACKLINYRKVHQLELWLNNDNDPQELAVALKILLRGWRDTLTEVVFDHVPNATISDEERQPPYRALAKCRAELADLPVLESFTTQHMYFNDVLLQDVCRNPRLQNITITNANISARGFRQLAACKTLERVYVSRCPKLGQSESDFLAARLPKVRYVTIDKPKTVRARGKRGATQ